MKKRHAGIDYVMLLECEPVLAEPMVRRLREAGIAARVFGPYTDFAGILPEATGPVGVWVPVAAEAEARALLEDAGGDARD
ncbi:DUF2007 domain-containing protein [Oceanithermus sp.]|uniref:putative signal transducing protein n=1 Tax=Oceanithermus sp. TaxID=2268145 RepID=UPI00257ED67F|nr:DUF2007 domain-containing protein [Oceanithermus sp.]